MAYTRHSLSFALLTAGVLALSACESATEPEEDHADEVEGVVLMLSGQTIASYDGEEGSWTGSLEVASGQETGRITVQFVTHEGEPVHVDEEEDHYLEVDVGNESIASFTHAAPRDYGGQLRGVAPGSTDIVFKLMHGEVGAGHPDFVTEPLGVTVNP